MVIRLPALLFIEKQVELEGVFSYYLTAVHSNLPLDKSPTPNRARRAIDPPLA